MEVIIAKNINDAWDQAKVLLNHNHVVRPSRVGEVMECLTPVTTAYAKPRERVLFDPDRNVNVFFSFMEALWMLAGRNDVAWLERFNSKIKDFVGPGPLLHDAYGHRWRKAFDLDGGADDDFADQLPKIIRMLKNNHNERRAVLTMWNPLWDLERPELPSVPCNTQCYFKIRNGALDILVTCRSNDIVFGAYSANNVQFSVLQEYMAAMIGVSVGTYYQVSDSWHAYTERWSAFGGFKESPTIDYYQASGVVPYDMVTHPESFDEELLWWMDRKDYIRSRVAPKNLFFNEVAEILWSAWDAYKEGHLDHALVILDMCKATDWRLAATAWIMRVKENRRMKAKLDSVKVSV